MRRLPTAFPLPIILAVLFCLPDLVPAPAAAQPEAWANYTVVFDATWSAETHPQDFPANAHWSGLVGGTHDDQIAFWTPGQLATPGIRQMAEWGSQPALIAEVEAAITAGHGGETVSGPVLWDSPGQVAVGLTVTAAHPLVTLTTMVAPSPDWFAGVRGLDLRDGDGWVEELVVDLYPWDAGTDSGATFTSADLVTDPAQPIAAITGAPFTPGVPVATLTFRREAVAPVPPATAAAAELRAVPNPFNPRTELRFDLPAGAREVTLAIHDARGRRVRGLTVPAGTGEQRVVWDGLSDGGRPLGSGVYLARLVVDGRATLRRLALVR